MSKRKTLSTRRMQALALVAEGLTHQQAAVRMCVSKKTIEKHLAVVRHSLNALSTAHAVALAIRSGRI